jgi:hypothetical protein
VNYAPQSERLERLESSREACADRRYRQGVSRVLDEVARRWKSEDRRDLGFELMAEASGYDGDRGSRSRWRACLAMRVVQSVLVGQERRETVSKARRKSGGSCSKFGLRACVAWPGTRGCFVVRRSTQTQEHSDPTLRS